MSGVTIEQLYQEHYERIYAWMMYHFAHQATAEDATQEVFLKVCKAFPTLKTTENIEGWLNTIAINLTKDIKRKQRSSHRYLSAYSLEAHQELNGNAGYIFTDIDIPDPIDGDPLDWWVQHDELQEQQQILQEHIQKLHNPEHRRAIVHDLQGEEVSDRKTLYEARRCLITQIKRALHQKPLSRAEQLERARKIRARFEAGATAPAIAREYGMSPSHVYRITRNQSWRDA